MTRSLKDHASDCLNLLAHCRDAIHAGGWERLAGLEQDYMTAFSHLKENVNAADTPVSEDEIPIIQALEREQRRLARHLKMKQQMIRDQLDVLSDAQSRLQRVKDFSQTISSV